MARYDIKYGIKTGSYVEFIGEYQEAVKKLNMILSAMAYPELAQNYKIVEIRKEVKK